MNSICTYAFATEEICRLKLNEQKTLDLEKERQYYTNQTKELMSSLKEVSTE